MAEDEPSRAEDGPLRAEDVRSRSGTKWLRYGRVGIGISTVHTEREASPNKLSEFMRALGGGGVRRTSREPSQLIN
jgi:hypothetical protein